MGSLSGLTWGLLGVTSCEVSLRVGGRRNDLSAGGIRLKLSYCVRESALLVMTTGAFAFTIGPRTFATLADCDDVLLL